MNCKHEELLAEATHTAMWFICPACTRGVCIGESGLKVLSGEAAASDRGMSGLIRDRLDGDNSYVIERLG